MRWSREAARHSAADVGLPADIPRNETARSRSWWIASVYDGGIHRINAGESTAPVSRYATLGKYRICLRSVWRSGRLYIIAAQEEWAFPLFVVSLLGVLAQTSNIWFLTNAISAMGAPAVVMPLVAIIIGTAMIVLTKSAISKGWLR
jgi:hypothetical protein